MERRAHSLQQMLTYFHFCISFSVFLCQFELQFITSKHRLHTLKTYRCCIVNFFVNHFLIRRYLIMYIVYGVK